MPVETRAAEQRRLNAPQPVPFTCVACMGDHPTPAIDVVGNSICQECYQRGIHPQFEAALRDESRYPPKWADQPLSIQPFAYQGLIVPEFRRDYERKEKEYAILAKDRVYCTCGQFLGAKATHTVRTKCVRDGRRTCPDCLATFQGTVRSHMCHFEHETHEVDHFQGLVQGRDYQICTCGCVVELTDGCNHMTCRIPACQREFCYICGEAAVERSNHWAPGRCPKYNQPGAANALHVPVRNEQDRAARVLVGERMRRISALLDRDVVPVVEGDAENAILRAVHARPENQLRRAHLQELRSIRDQATALSNAPELDPDAREGMDTMRALGHFMLTMTFDLLTYVTHMLGDVGQGFLRRFVLGPLDLRNQVVFLAWHENFRAIPNVMQRLLPIFDASMHAAEGRFEALNGMARNALENHAADE